MPHPVVLAIAILGGLVSVTAVIAAFAKGVKFFLNWGALMERVSQALEQIATLLKEHAHLDTRLSVAEERTSQLDRRLTTLEQDQA